MSKAKDSIMIMMNECKMMKMMPSKRTKTTTTTTTTQATNHHHAMDPCTSQLGGLGEQGRGPPMPTTKGGMVTMDQSSIMIITDSTTRASPKIDGPDKGKIVAVEVVPQLEMGEHSRTKLEPPKDSRIKEEQTEQPKMDRTKGSNPKNARKTELRTPSKKQKVPKVAKLQPKITSFITQQPGLRKGGPGDLREIAKRDWYRKEKPSLE